jgi:hypothetical protein
MKDILQRVERIFEEWKEEGWEYGIGGRDGRGRRCMKDSSRGWKRVGREEDRMEE